MEKFHKNSTKTSSEFRKMHLYEIGIHLTTSYALTTSTRDCTRCRSTCRHRNSTVRGCTGRICIWTRTRCRRPAAATSPATVGTPPRLQLQWLRWWRRPAAAPAMPSFARSRKPNDNNNDGDDYTITTTDYKNNYDNVYNDDYNDDYDDDAAQRRTPNRVRRSTTALAAEDDDARYLAWRFAYQSAVPRPPTPREASDCRNRYGPERVDAPVARSSGTHHDDDDDDDDSRRLYARPLGKFY